jgi:hypothetical protein
MFTNLEHAEDNIWTIREEVTGGWRKFHAEELRDLYDYQVLERSIQEG